MSNNKTMLFVESVGLKRINISKNKSILHSESFVDLGGAFGN